MTELLQYLPLLIPILLIEWGLAIAALVNILRHKTYRCGNRALWIIVSLFVGIIGPILYFTIGKEKEA